MPHNTAAADHIKQTRESVGMSTPDGVENGYGYRLVMFAGSGPSPVPLTGAKSIHPGRNLVLLDVLKHELGGGRQTVGHSSWLRASCDVWKSEKSLVARFGDAVAPMS